MVILREYCQKNDENYPEIVIHYNFFYFYCYSLQFCLLFIPLVKEKPVLKEHRNIDPFLVLPTPQQLVDLVVLRGGQLGALTHLRQVGHQS